MEDRKQKKKKTKQLLTMYQEENFKKLLHGGEKLNF